MARHNAKPLEEMLAEHLQDSDGSPLPLGSEALLTGLLITAKRMDTDSSWILTNNPKAKYWRKTFDEQTFLPNKLYQLQHLIRASCSAPTYLSVPKIRISDGKNSDDDGSYTDLEIGTFVDGAITGHNFPALIALQVATLPSYGFCWGAGEDKLSILSIGTGQFRNRFKTRTGFWHPKDRLTPAAIRGVQSLKGLISETQNIVLHTMQALSASHKPWYINSEIEGLDGEAMTVNNEKLFRFRHIDVRLNDKPVSRPDERDVMDLLGYSGQDAKHRRKQTIKELRQMDNGKRDIHKQCYKIGLALGKDLDERDLFLNN